MATNRNGGMLRLIAPRHDDDDDADDNEGPRPRTSLRIIGLCCLYTSLLTFVVHFSAYFVCSVFPRECRSRCWVRWEIEQPFDGQLFQEYSSEKSSKSVNPFTIDNVVVPFLRHSVVHRSQSLASHLLFLSHSHSLLYINSGNLQWHFLNIAG